MYLIRLDDACERMDLYKWSKMESLLKKYNVLPIVGIIPDNKDKSFDKYPLDKNFWQKVKNWQKAKWTIAMHGYQHIYNTNSGGINPVQNRSEFAGLSLEEKKKKIKKGYDLLTKKSIEPKVFFAPSHTFDSNTLKALKDTTNIRIISDTIASNIYYRDGFYFIPQQSGHVRSLPFKIVTFCYHPNEMIEEDFLKLEAFIKKNNRKFIPFDSIILRERNYSFFDNVLKNVYFKRRKGL